MELSEEQIKDYGLSEEQVGKLNTWSVNAIADTKKEYDGLANKNAEAILDGALLKVSTDTKIARNQGEKVGDYLQRSWNEFNSNSITETENAKKEYDEKVKNFKGDADLIKRIGDLDKTNDDLLKKYANYDEVLQTSEKYDSLLQKHNETKKQVAYGGVKPNFPKEVNAYEAKAKWNEFISKTEESYNIEIVDGVAIAIDKENKHKNTKLSELVSLDNGISELLVGRQQSGTGHQEIKKIEIKDVPFEVSEDAKKDSNKRAVVIRDYLATKGMNNRSDNYSTEFAKYNKLILNG